jgi:hypothetical protein
MRVISEKYDDFGNMTGYETDDGQIISKDRAIEMARQGEIQGVMSGVNENGERVLHIISDRGSGETVNPMNHVDEMEWAVYAKKTIF